MSSPPSKRIIIADGHRDILYGLAFMLKATDDLLLVGQAMNGIDAIVLCEQHRPDVLLVSLALPKVDGIAVTRLVHYACPETRIIALLNFDCEDTQAQAILRAGALSYLYKGASVIEILNAIYRATKLY